MKLTFVIVAASMALAGAVSAQTAASASPSDGNRGYIEGVIQSSFGNVTSQSFGAEGGITIAHQLVVFGEFGRVRDATPPEVGVAAQSIASYIAAQAQGVNYSVRQPVTFAVAGLKYLIPYDADLQPYVLAGVGIGRYTRDVSFTVGGTDITSSIGQYGVALGSDLSGSTTKPMVTAGGGLAWTVSGPWVIDFQFRYGHIFADGEGMNLIRAGVGIGVRF